MVHFPTIPTIHPDQQVVPVVVPILEHRKIGRKESDPFLFHHSLNQQRKGHPITWSRNSRIYLWLVLEASIQYQLFHCWLGDHVLIAALAADKQYPCHPLPSPAQNHRHQYSTDFGFFPGENYLQSVWPIPPWTSQTAWQPEDTKAGYPYLGRPPW